MAQYTITEERIVRIAQHAAEFAASHLTKVCDIDLGASVQASKAAGDSFAQAMSLALRERGIKVVA